MLDTIFCKLQSQPSLNPSYNIRTLETQAKKEFIHFDKSNRLYVYLPHWGDRLEYLKNLRRLIFQRKAAFLAYSFPREILSSNWRLTLESFKLIQDLVRQDIIDLQLQYGFEEVIILANSLGCVHACMIASRDPLINKIYLLSPGHCLAESMWEGIRTQFLKREFEKKGITLTELKNFWAALAPENNVDLRGMAAHVYLSRSDQVIPFTHGVRLVEAMQRAGTETKVMINNHWGHYGTIGAFYLFPDRYLTV